MVWVLGLSVPCDMEVLFLPSGNLEFSDPGTGCLCFNRGREKEESLGGGEGQVSSISQETRDKQLHQGEEEKKAKNKCYALATVRMEAMPDIDALGRTVCMCCGGF